MSLIARSVEHLRVGVDRESVDINLQRVYEHWLKRSEWKARSEAIPLVIGTDPEHWEAYVCEHGLVDQEQGLWHLFAEANGIGSNEELVPVPLVYDWFRTNAVELPVSLSRLYDFIRQVSFRAEPAEIVADGISESNSAVSENEVEIVLGAALSLVAKVPERCRDAHGFISGSVVSELIIDTAARWFPSGPPTITSTQMAELIDKWLQ